MSIEVLPLPVLIFSIGGATISLIVGIWTGWYFLSAILKGIWERFRENEKL
jgi:hypothetical protein